MISTIGNFSLSAAMLVAAGAILASVYSVRFRSERAAALARWCVVLIAVCFTIAAGALLRAILHSDFQFQYVVDYTERALPTGYKYAAFWAGQAGSLLLWAWMLGVMCAMAVWQYRKKTGGEFALATATMALVLAFCATVLILDSDPTDGYTNPFTLVKQAIIPEDGHGMNPMLQDPGMIFHPPLLFLGYAGFTIPFAVLIGVLAVGRRDNRWLADIRRWVLASWVFLTAGIVLGAWWAYVELGWGGYWAWDPVENASLLPWLTATALLHSMVAQQHRGMFKIWNASLVAASFILCIFGTYLTRSGVIQSVHAFPESYIGQIFLAFLVLLVVGSVALILIRLPRLWTEHRLEGLISREGAFLFGNILLVVMMLTTLVGTIFPIPSAWFGEAITVKPEFYNVIVAPMGLLLAFIMAHGPLLAFGKTAAQKIIRDVTPAGIISVLITLLTVIFSKGIRAGYVEAWQTLEEAHASLGLVAGVREGMAAAIGPTAAVLSVFIASLGTFVVIISFIKTVAARRKGTGENPLAAALRLLDADKRRYGAQVAHLGVMLLILGVVGSSVFKTDRQQVLTVGEPAQIGVYELTVLSLNNTRGPNYDATAAEVRVVGPGGEALVLRPELRRYNKWRQQVNAEVALQSTLVKDVYLILGGYSPTQANLQILVSPLVVWIWLGGIVLCAGGIYAMLPRFLPRLAHEPVTVRPDAANASSASSSRPALRPVSREATEAEASS